VRWVFRAFGSAVELERCGEGGCEGVGAGGELVEGEDALGVGFGGEGLAGGGVRRYGGRDERARGAGGVCAFFKERSDEGGWAVVGLEGSELGEDGLRVPKLGGEGAEAGVEAALVGVGFEEIGLAYLEGPTATAAGIGPDVGGRADGDVWCEGFGDVDGVVHEVDLVIALVGDVALGDGGAYEELRVRGDGSAGGCGWAIAGVGCCGEQEQRG